MPPMGTITESATYETTIPQLEIDTPAQGGPSGAANAQAQKLANRTKWLKAQLDPLLGKIFFSLNYGATATVGNSGTYQNADGNAYAGVAYPLASPDYTTPNDGITRVYKITMTSFGNFTTSSSGNIQMILYTMLTGPTYSALLTWNFRNGYQQICSTKIISIGPNVKMKMMFGNNATGANAVFTDSQLIIEEV